MKLRIPLLLLLIFSVVPGMIFYLLPVSSQAPGVLIALLGIVALLTSALRVQSVRVLVGAAMLGLFLVLHFAVARLLVPVDPMRFCGSLVLFLIMVVLATSIGPLLFGAIDAIALNRLFWGFVVCAAFAVLGVEFGTVNSTSKPVFPFSEPSIFALSLAPVFLFVCATSRGWRRLLFGGVVLAIALLLQNFTLLAVVAIVLTLCLPLRGTLIMLAAGAAVALLGSIDQFSYYTNRLDFSSGSQNLTALVYLQGWQMIFESWVNSWGWGIGFQQLGVNGTAVDASELILALTGDVSNLHDGGFVLAKLISEMGIFGVVAVGLYMMVALRSLRQLRAVALGRPHVQVAAGRLLAHAVVLAYFVEIFMRGVGYLTGTGALFVAALSYLYGWQRASTRSPRTSSPPTSRRHASGT